MGSGHLRGILPISYRLDHQKLNPVVPTLSPHATFHMTFPFNQPVRQILDQQIDRRLEEANELSSPQDPESSS